MGKANKSENVQVILRVRPLNKKEVAAGHVDVVKLDIANNMVGVDEAGVDGRQWAFDGVYNNSFAQRDVYNQSIRPLVDTVLAGYNGTIFAYGQSGTGKSYSMAGDLNNKEQYGIIPNALVHIFSHISEQKEDTKLEYQVKASYVELYNGKCRDLLVDGQHALDIKENVQKQFFVKDLSLWDVTSVEGAMNLMEEGVLRREVKATDLNADSSRSHSLFTLYVKVWDKEQDVRTESKLNLVDLAGSERQSKTGATGDTLKEGNAINLSLTALGTVIDCLVKQKGHIPYRSTHLTMLLKDGLGGNSRTVIVGTIGPSGNNSHETVSTLRFIDRAKQIKNKPKVQMDPKDAKIAELMELVHKLKKQLGIDSGAEDGDEEGGEGGGGEEGVGEEGTTTNKGKRAVLFDDEIEKYKQRIEQLEMEVSASQEATDAARSLEAHVDAKEAALKDIFEKKEAKLLEEISEMKDRYSLQDSSGAADQYNELLNICTEFLVQVDTGMEWVNTIRKAPPATTGSDGKGGNTIVDGLCQDDSPEPGTLLPTTDDIRNGLRSLSVNGVDMRHHALRKHSLHASPAASLRGGLPPDVAVVDPSSSSSPLRQPHPPNPAPQGKFNRSSVTTDGTPNNATTAVPLSTSNIKAGGGSTSPPPAAVANLQNDGDEDDQFPTKEKKKKKDKKEKKSGGKKGGDASGGGGTSSSTVAAAVLPAAAVGQALEKLGLSGDMMAVAKTAIEDLLAQQRAAVFEEQRKRAQQQQGGGQKEGDWGELMAAYEQLQDEVETAQTGMTKQRQQLDKARAVADKKISEVTSLKEHIDALREELAHKHAQHATELEKQQEQLIHQFNKKTDQMIAKQSKAAKADRKSHAALAKKLEEAGDEFQSLEETYDCKVMEYENLLRDYEELKVEMLRKYKGTNNGSFLTGNMTPLYNGDSGGSGGIPSREGSRGTQGSSSSQFRSASNTVMLNKLQSGGGGGGGAPRTAPEGSGLKLPPVASATRTPNDLPLLRR